MPDDAPGTQRPRRWRSVGLRSLMLLVLAVALGLAWLEKQVRDHREARATILRHDGLYFFEYEPVNPSPRERRTWVPGWLRRAIDEEYFHDVTWIRIEGPRFGDEELRRLRPLDRVEGLGIVGTAITDDGLRSLRGLRSVQALFLNGNWIGDAGIDNLDLASMPRLEFIDVSRTLVSEAKVAELRRRFPKLTVNDDGGFQRHIVPGEGRGSHRFRKPGEYLEPERVFPTDRDRPR